MAEVIYCALQSFFAAVDNAYALYDAEKERVRKTIDEQVKALCDRLQSELGAKAKELDEQYEQEGRNAATNIIAALGTILQAAASGAIGRGSLFVVTSEQYTSDQGTVHTARLARLIPIEWNESEQRTEGDRELSVGDGDILWEGNLQLDEKGTSILIGGNSWCPVRDIQDCIHYVEAPFAGTTDEELVAFWKELKDGGYTPAILSIFPKDFRAPVEIGEVFNFGSCSHHSGEIEAIGVVMPTGRLAIASRYEGEQSDDESVCRFVGVAPQQDWMPDLTARGAGMYNADELVAATAEELAWLDGRDDIVVSDPKEITDGPRLLEGEHDEE